MLEEVSLRPSGCDSQSGPKSSWDEVPEEHEDSVTPINDFHFFSFFDGTNDVLGYIFWLELEWISTACYEVCLYKSGSDVCDGDREMAHSCLLGKTFEIMVLESLGGRVGRSCTETFGSGNGSDAGNAGF